MDAAVCSFFDRGPKVNCDYGHFRITEVTVGNVFLFTVTSHLGCDFVVWSRTPTTPTTTFSYHGPAGKSKRGRGGGRQRLPPRRRSVVPTATAAAAADGDDGPVALVQRHEVMLAHDLKTQPRIERHVPFLLCHQPDLPHYDVVTTTAGVVSGHRWT